LLGALAGNLFETGEGDGIVDSRPPFGLARSRMPPKNCRFSTTVSIG
jgi:hypothetical protein